MEITGTCVNYFPSNSKYSLSVYIYKYIFNVDIQFCYKILICTVFGRSMCKEPFTSISVYMSKTSTCNIFLKFLHYLQ